MTTVTLAELKDGIYDALMKVSTNTSKTEIRLANNSKDDYIKNTRIIIRVLYEYDHIDALAVVKTKEDFGDHTAAIGSAVIHRSLLTSLNDFDIFAGSIYDGIYRYIYDNIFNVEPDIKFKIIIKNRPEIKNSISKSNYLKLCKDFKHYPCTSNPEKIASAMTKLIDDHIMCDLYISGYNAELNNDISVHLTLSKDENMFGETMYTLRGWKSYCIDGNKSVVITVKDIYYTFDFILEDVDVIAMDGDISKENYYEYIKSTTEDMYETIVDSVIELFKMINTSTNNDKSFSIGYY